MHVRNTSRVVFYGKAPLAGEVAVVGIEKPTTCRKSKRQAALQLSHIAAARRFRRTLAAYLDDKAGFREDQPRWPKGSGESSGRWSGGHGTGTGEQNETTQTKGGHHFVPREIFTNKASGLSEEAARVFSQGVTGPLRTDFHRWNEDHKLYNAAVKESFYKFVKERGIDPARMTTAQASEFLKMIRGSSDPRIGGYNMKIFWREIIFYIRRGPVIKGNE